MWYNCQQKLYQSNQLISQFISEIKFKYEIKERLVPLCWKKSKSPSKRIWTHCAVVEVADKFCNSDINFLEKIPLYTFIWNSCFIRNFRVGLLMHKNPLRGTFFRLDLNCKKNLNPLCSSWGSRQVLQFRSSMKNVAGVDFRALVVLL